MVFSGHRSLTRDLETQAAVVTTNQELRASLHSVSATKYIGTGMVYT